MTIIIFPTRKKESLYDDDIDLEPAYIDADELAVKLISWKWNEDNQYGGWQVAMVFQVTQGEYMGQTITGYRNVKQAFDNGTAEVASRSYISRDHKALFGSSCTHLAIDQFSNKVIKVKIQHKRDRSYVGEFIGRMKSSAHMSHLEAVR